MIQKFQLFRAMSPNDAPTSGKSPTSGDSIQSVGTETLHALPSGCLYKLYMKHMSIFITK